MNLSCGADFNFLAVCLTPNRHWNWFKKRKRWKRRYRPLIFDRLLMVVD